MAEKIMFEIWFQWNQRESKPAKRATAEAAGFGPMIKAAQQHMDSDPTIRTAVISPLSPINGAYPKEVLYRDGKGKNSPVKRVEAP